MRAFCGPGRAAGRVALKFRAAVTNFGPRATLRQTSGRQLAADNTPLEML